jgi:peptide/nickel transport system substrate-binding protein
MTAPMEARMPARSRVAVLALILVTLLAGCGQSTPTAGDAQRAPDTASARPNGPKRLVTAVTSDLPSLRTVLSRAAGGTLAGAPELEQLMHAGLTIVDHTATLRPQLAEAVPSVENGLWKVFPDGRMETTWRIREGARWHDGTPVTAEDFVFTARVAQDPSLVAFRHIAFEAVEGVDASDPRTLVITWQRPFIEADHMFAADGSVQNLPLPRHLLEKAFQDNRAGFLEISALGADEFVGAGPYKLKEWVRGASVQLEAFDQYVLGRPRIDFIEVKFIPDPNTMLANILGGTVETPIGRGVGFEHGLQLSEQWRDGKVEYSSGGSIKVWAQLLYPNPTIVGDVRFRRALYHAIDRQQLIDTLLAGRSEIAHTQITPSDPEYPDLIGRAVRYEYDPRRTAQIMEGMGYARAADGMYRDRRGERLVIEYRSSPMDILRKTKLVVADYWQSVGVTVNVVDDPPNRRGDNEYRAMYPGFDMSRGNSGTEAFRTFHSSEARGAQNRYIGQNVPNYVNPDLDALIDRFYVTIPRTERLRVAGDIVHHLTDQVIVMDQFYDATTTAVGNRLVNVAARVARGGTNTWNAHEWDFR